MAARPLRALPLAAATAFHLLAQQSTPPSYPPPGSPDFAADNVEGLLATPNPKVRYAWLRPVHWKHAAPGLHIGQGIPALTAAERTQIVKVFDAVSAALQATPEGSGGKGFWVNEDRNIGRLSRTELPTNAPAARWPLQFEIGFYPFYHEDVQDNNGQWRTSRRGETESAYFEFNLLPGRVDQPIVATESRGPDLSPIEFYLRPRETNRVAGLPVYEGQTLVMARAGRDPWAPAPLGRLLKTALPMYEADRKTAEQRLEGYKKTNDELQSAEWERAEWERFEKDNGALKTSRPSNYAARKAGREHYIKVTRAEAAAAADPKRGDAAGAWYWNPLDAHEELTRRMASMTPEQAGQPACYLEAKEGKESSGRYQAKGAFVLAAGAPSDCRPVVMDNPEYFDLKPGRATVQIATLRSFGRCMVFRNGQMVAKVWGVVYKAAPPQGCHRHGLMWRELDWSKIAGLVMP